MAHITTLLFDFGGVLINLDMTRTLEAFGRLGLNALDDYSATYQQGLFGKFEQGLITAAEFREAIRKALGKQVADDGIDEAWNAILGEIPPQRVGMLKSVRLHYRTFLLSNSNEIHYRKYLEYLRKEYGYGSFDELFDGTCFSFQCGMKKPDPSIFRFMEKKFGMLPEETLFIDDSEINIEAARKLGYETYLLPPGSDVAELFEEGIFGI